MLNAVKKTSPIGIEPGTKRFAVDGPYHWATEVCSLGVDTKFTNTTHRSTKKNERQELRQKISPEKLRLY